MRSSFASASDNNGASGVLQPTDEKNEGVPYEMEAQIVTAMRTANDKAITIASLKLR